MRTLWCLFAISWIVVTSAFGQPSLEVKRKPTSWTRKTGNAAEISDLLAKATSKEVPGEFTTEHRVQQGRRFHHRSRLNSASKKATSAVPEVRGIGRRRERRSPGNRPEQAAPTSGKWTNPRTNIIGGEISLPSRWEWSVALVSEQFGTGFVCGATIISPMWLVTAAHCVYSATGQIYALIGAWNLTADDYKDKVLVEEIIVHPGFELRQTSMYDIALLKLVREANVTNSPQSILTLPNLLFNLFELNPNCYIIGWGVTEPGSTTLSAILRQKRVNVISSVECQRRWDEGFVPVEIAHTNLCIDEGVDGDISACSGDSGSPLQCYDLSDRVWKLAGLSSWGSSSCSTYPSVYTKVQAFLDWIYETISTPNNLFDRRPRNPDPDDSK